MQNTITFTYNGEDKSINVKDCLTLTEAIALSASVVSGCLSDDELGMYLKDFYIKSYTIKYFTDYIMPDDIEQQYNLIYGTTLYEDIVFSEKFNNEQYQVVLEGIEKQLQIEIQKAANTTKLDNLFETITEVIKKVDDKIDISEIGSLLTKLNNVEKIDEKILAETVMYLQQKPKRSKKKGAV